MLAIDRFSWAFSCQRTAPVVGSRMMAAAARTSGTSSPDESVLNRGVIAVWRARIRTDSRALAAARARASLARRALMSWPNTLFCER